MKHYSTIVIEIQAKTDTGDATEEQLKEVTDGALLALAHETCSKAIGKTFEDENGYLKYNVKVIRNEII